MTHQWVIIHTFGNTELAYEVTVGIFFTTFVTHPFSMELMDANITPVFLSFLFYLHKTLVRKVKLRHRLPHMVVQDEHCTRAPH